MIEDITTDACFTKVVESYRVRLTIQIALSLAMVTMTGYGLENESTAVFLIAAVLPGLSLYADYIVKGMIATPFLYKALVNESGKDDCESIPLLFLDFVRGGESHFARIARMPSSEERRSLFRSAYLRRGLSWKILILGGAAAVELMLYFFVG